VAVQYQPGELHTETHPEEDIKLDEALEYLVDGKHLLDLPISSQELVHFPAKFVIDRPCKRDVSELRDGDDDWKDGCKDVDRDVGETIL